MPTTRPQRTFVRWILLVGLATLFCIAWISPLGNYMRAPFAAVGVPVLRTTRAIVSWIADLPKPLRNKQALLNQLTDSQKQISALQQENAQLKSLIKDSATEDRLKEYTERLRSLAVTAHVIGRSVIGHQTVTIDKGSHDGIRENLPVITDAGTIIGTIDRVSLLTSEILLITDPSQAIAAKVQNDASSPGVVKGTYGVSLSLELIPQNDALAVGQTVVTSSVNPAIPPDILIGSISKVIKDEGAIFQTAQISVTTPIERVEIVSVLLTQHENP